MPSRSSFTIVYSLRLPDWGVARGAGVTVRKYGESVIGPPHSCRDHPADRPASCWRRRYRSPCGARHLRSGDAGPGRRCPARQPQPPHARRLRRLGVRDTEPGPVRPAGDALRPSLRRIAPVHAGPSRHPLRRGGLPLEAVGLDRAMGGRGHRPAAGGGRRHQAGDGPPAPLRGRRRELPHRLHRVGLRAGPRKRSVADATRPELDRRAGLRSPAHAVRQLTRLLPRGGRVPRPPHDGGRGALARGRTRRTTRSSCCSSTSSTRTNRSTRPSPTRRCTTTAGRDRT